MASSAFKYQLEEHKNLTTEPHWSLGSNGQRQWTPAKYQKKMILARRMKGRPRIVTTNREITLADNRSPIPTPTSSTMIALAADMPPNSKKYDKLARRVTPKHCCSVLA